MFSGIQNFLGINQRIVEIKNYKFKVNKKIAKQFQEDIQDILSTIILLDYKYVVNEQKTTKTRTVDLFFATQTNNCHLSLIINKRGILRDSFLSFGNHITGRTMLFALEHNNFLKATQKMKEFVQNCN